MMGLTLAERRAVTEMTAIRYVVADRRVKSRILDELCANTGWHRNHARKALKAALHPKVVTPKAKSASTQIWAECHRCTYGLRVASCQDAREGGFVASCDCARLGEPRGNRFWWRIANPDARRLRPQGRHRGR